MHPYILQQQEKVNVTEIIHMLKSALADEFNATQNYWMQGKLVLDGPWHDEIQKELFQHKDEEMKHANWLIDRILHLSAGMSVTPEIRPLDWDRFAGCRYTPAQSWDPKSIIKDAYDGEQCAIQHYTKIAKFVKNKDTVTYDLVQKIIEEEYEHSSDLRKLADMMDSNKKK